MAFRTNQCDQTSFVDKTNSLTAREVKHLDQSWVYYFADYIFPAIDENMFAVLYSKNRASRPCTPINVIVGALMLKELFDNSDDEMVDALMYDIRFQIALHTTSGYKEQPLSDKTLSRFRKRCYGYELEKGIDLYHECVNKLGARMAKLMDLTKTVRRMDSMMIDSNIRKLSRMELIYECIHKLAHYLYKHDPEMLSEDLMHYADSDDYNQIFYHQRSSDSEKTLGQLLYDAERLLGLCESSHSDREEYRLLARCIEEQTVVKDGKRKLREKGDGGMNSSMMQNPSDPDATYNFKAGQEHRGFAANLEESVGEHGSIVTDYQFEQNNYGDSNFLKDSLEQIPDDSEPSILVADGAFSGSDNIDLAGQKNVTLVNTNLTGKATPDIMADFEFSEDGTEIQSCPAGYAPNRCSYSQSSGQCSASFSSEHCTACPYKDKCPVEIGVRAARVKASKKAQQRARSQRYRSTEEFKNLSRLRNGIETVPSNLRRNYHLDKLPRGKLRAKFFFGSKIAALNFRKFVNYATGKGNYAQNPVIMSQNLELE